MTLQEQIDAYAADKSTSVDNPVDNSGSGG